MDDCTSARLTLNKGQNIIRGAVINGPGMSDFCVRFLDENGEPVKDISLWLQMKLVDHLFKISIAIEMSVIMKLKLKYWVAVFCFQRV